MVSSEGGKTDGSNLPVEKRRDPRKDVPKGEKFPVILGHPDGTFDISREIDRKKLVDPVPARLLAAQNANCTIENVSERGLCICSVANLSKGQRVGVFFQFLTEISKEAKGITLICEVKWHRVNKANQMAYLTGLAIIENSDSNSYKEFVDSLPAFSQAHV